jgi:hypothetical protein
MILVVSSRIGVNHDYDGGFFDEPDGMPALLAVHYAVQQESDVGIIPYPLSELE